MQTDTSVKPTQTSTIAEAPPVSTDWPSPTAEKAAKRKIHLKPIVITIVIASIILAAYFALPTLFKQGPEQDIQLFKVTRRSFPIILQEKGDLEAEDSIDIRCELEGRSTIIYLIDEGTHAKKGDLLVELASDEIDEDIRDAEIKVASSQADYEAEVKEYEILKDENESKIRKAKLALKLAELALSKYKEGEATELRQDAALAEEKAKYVLNRAKEELKDSEDLYKQGYITRIELEDDRFDKYQAEQDLKKAELAKKVLEKYTITMDLEKKQSDVDEAKKDLARTEKEAQAAEAKSKAAVDAAKSELDLVVDKLTKLKDQKKKSKIYAPADGLVVYSKEGSWFRSETQIEVGAQVHERQALITLPDTSQMKVVARVHEAKMEMLELGLPATIEIEGFNDRIFSGTVSKIGVLADSRNRWLNPNLKEYETEILLDESYEGLKPGTTARVEILVTQLNDVLAVPVQSVFGKDGKYYVFTDNQGDTKPTEVKIGLASNEYVEIKSGLKEGDKVRLSVTDDMKLKIPGSKNDKKNNKKINKKQGDRTQRGNRRPNQAERGKQAPAS